MSNSINTNKPTEQYRPINCSFHDMLLAKATFKESCKIQYLEDKNQHTIQDIIVDVYTKDKAEYMVLKQGLIIRLDYIISINGELLPESNCFI